MAAQGLRRARGAGTLPRCARPVVGPLTPRNKGAGGDVRAGWGPPGAPAWAHPGGGARVAERLGLLAGPGPALDPPLPCPRPPGPLPAPGGGGGRGQPAPVPPPGSVPLPGTRR